MFGVSRFSLLTRQTSGIVQCFPKCKFVLTKIPVKTRPSCLSQHGRTNNSNTPFHNSLSVRSPADCISPQNVIKRVFSTNGKRQKGMAKMKQLIKAYWYIVIPLHLILEVLWGFLFYAILIIGVDVAPLMRLMQFDEERIQNFQKKLHSKGGMFTMVYLLLRIASPVRYPLTIAIATVMIRYLEKRGFREFDANMRQKFAVMWKRFFKKR